MNIPGKNHLTVLLTLKFAFFLNHTVPIPSFGVRGKEKKERKRSHGVTLLTPNSRATKSQIQDAKYR